MANELTVTCHASLNDSDGTTLKISSPTQAKSFTPTTKIASQFVVAVGTSEESVDFGDITPGLVILENLDATNFVEWTTVTTNYDQKLLPNNDRAMFRFSSTQTLYVKADTASCNILVTAFNT